MKESIELRTIFEKGKFVTNDYQFVALDGEIYKIAVDDLKKVNDLIAAIKSKKQKEVELEIDDFTYDPEIKPAEEIQGFTKKNVLNELKIIREALGEGFKLNDQRLELKNILVIDPDGEFYKMFINNKKRQENMKKYLRERINVNSLADDDKPEKSSLIGTQQYLMEGTILAKDDDNLKLNILDKKTLCEVIGIQYIYKTYDNNTSNTETIRLIDDNVKKVKEIDYNFRQTYKDAIIIDLIVKVNGNTYNVNPEYLILSSENKIKKGV